MNTLRVVLASAAIALAAPAARAGEGVCDHCGCSACVRKVCVPKWIEKEVIKVCWDHKCEDVCIPGPSKKCGVECRDDQCGSWSFTVWEPSCARVKTRRVPVKTEVKRKVPAVEWVVEKRCAECCYAASADVTTPATPPTPGAHGPKPQTPAPNQPSRR